MIKLIKVVLFVFLITFFNSCNQNTNQIESYPTYYVQLCIKKGSNLERTFGRNFGKLEEFRNEFITNDSSAYVWAWRSLKSVRELNSSTGEKKDLFLDINEFKLYDQYKVEITDSVYFKGIENYPNPIN